MAFLFFGCSGKNRLPKDTPSPLADGKVISFSIEGRVDMVRDSFFKYYLRQEDGELLFDASYGVIDDDGFKQIELEKKIVKQEDMEVLRALCEKFNFTQKQRDYRPQKQTRAQKKNASQIMDGSYAGCTVIWENGATYRESGQTIECETVMKTFFKTLVERIEKDDK
jgi:hypothetical protein